MRTYQTLSLERGLYLSVVIVLILCSSGLANPSFQPVFNPKIDIGRTSEEIKIDGKLEEATWLMARPADNFVERFPGDLTKPDVETYAYITYDDENLYVAFLCYDDPASIRATMTQRDQYEGDDEVGVLIDPYGGAAWAYQFYVNPHGVQKDQLWSSIIGEDRGYDLIWQSAAHITDSGYSVEMAVPFASMRFHNRNVQSWKVDFRRNRPRESFNEYSWAAYDRDDACGVCQYGTVEGIEDVQPGKGLEIMPTVIANQYGSRDDEGLFDNDDIDGELSLFSKYSVNSDITLEAALNPDFSQVEADAGQIDVNTTIALFYPERRPFFQEGSDIFRTLFNSFYTRTINDPQFATKLTGRVGRTSIGFISARDENSPYMIPLEEGSIVLNAGKSLVNAVRGSKTFGEDSQLGFIVTDRRFEGNGSGTIVALDGDIRIAKNLKIDGQYIGSHTSEQDSNPDGSDFGDMTFDDGKHTVNLDGESYYGTAFITRLKRQARNLSFFLDYNQVSPSYRTQTGFDPLTDYRRTSLWTGYNIYFDEGLVERVSPQVYSSGEWAFDGHRREANINVSTDARLRYAQTNVNVGYRRWSREFGGVDFNDLWMVNLNLRSQLNNAIGYNIHVGRGKSLAVRSQAKGTQTSFDAELVLKPDDRLIVEPTFNYSRSTHIDTGEELFSGYITRARFRYQASREISVRLVVQYDNFRERWDVDPLLTYRISPFSVFYVGSTYDYNQYITSLTDETQWKLSSRQFFMKLQYMFQT